MKRPSFQFYPGDWQANSNLRRCTHDEKGVWMDVMCILHDQAEYGIVRWTLRELAQAVGCTVSKLNSLVGKQVLKGADTAKTCEPLIYVPRSGRKDGPPVTLIRQQPGPVWYSSRMVVDEYKRVLRGESGSSASGAPDPSPMPPFGDGSGEHPTHHHSRARPSSSSSSSSSSKTNAAESGGNATTPIPPADAGHSQQRTQIDPEFAPDDANRQLALSHALDVVEEVERFVAHFTGNGDVQANWQSRFHKWLLDAKRYRDEKQQRSSFVSSLSSARKPIPGSKEANRIAYLASAEEARRRLGLDEPGQPVERDITPLASRVFDDDGRGQ